jgi:hypothetical protein
MEYKLVSFRDYDQSMKKVLLLRHDLDYTLDGVLNFATLEKDRGATATYFIRLHAPEYNPFEYRAYTLIRKLLDMGHEIGLHFESTKFESLTGEDPVMMFKKEKEVLERIFDVNVETAVQHRDLCMYSEDDFFFFDKFSKEDVGLKRYAHEPAFENDFKYLSDSSSRWNDGCLCENLGKHDKIQALTHPDWWFEEHYHLKARVHHPY